MEAADMDNARTSEDGKAATNVHAWHANCVSAYL